MPHLGSHLLLCSLLSLHPPLFLYIYILIYSLCFPLSLISKAFLGHCPFLSGTFYSSVLSGFLTLSLVTLSHASYSPIYLVYSHSHPPTPLSLSLLDVCSMGIGIFSLRQRQEQYLTNSKCSNSILNQLGGWGWGNIYIFNYYDDLETNLKRFTVFL